MCKAALALQTRTAVPLCPQARSSLSCYRRGKEVHSEEPITGKGAPTPRPLWAALPRCETVTHGGRQVLSSHQRGALWGFALCS